MKLASIFGIIVVLILIALFEWAKMKKNQKREKWTLVILIMAGGLIASLLVFFPDMPGPTQLIEMIFKPLGKSVSFK